MGIYYLWDEQRRINTNRSGGNYWFAYITEILSRLGAKGRPVLPEQAGDITLGKRDVVFIGAGDVPAKALPALRTWQNNGATIIGFGTTGVDDVFGIQTTGCTDQPDDFTINGYFAVRGNKKQQFLPSPEADPRLCVFTPVVVTEPKSADVCADIELNGVSYPAFYQNKNAYYFTFDVTQTLWAAAQGKPVYEGTAMFPRCSRNTDARITPDGYDTHIAYGDYYTYIIQSILYRMNVPMLHRLPPDADGSVPDLLLYHAGDEDATPKVSNRASEIMRERGYAYQINMMPAGEDMHFTTTQEEYAVIRARGHRVSMHYNMVENQPWCDWSAENFRKQYEAYLCYAGDPCVSSVGHCLVHVGWAERSRYQEALGILGDGSRFGEKDPEDLNAFNLYGFAFGTGYPYFIYDDHEHNNRRLNIADLPIAYYEPRIGGKYVDGAEKIRRCMEDAAYFGRMLTVFTHPHYVADNYTYDNSITLAAFDEFDRYAAEHGLNVVHSEPDSVCLFWHGRERSDVSYHDDGDVITCRVDCAADAGLIVKIPVNDAASVSVDGNHIEPVFKMVDGLKWLMVPVTGKGGRLIEVRRAR